MENILDPRVQRWNPIPSPFFGCAMSNPDHPTRRFTDRVADYVRYRPGYPDDLTEYMRKNLGWGPGCVLADLGSGTGLFTEKLLELGAVVHAIEPNAAMRAAAEEALLGRPGFLSEPGSAEATGLDPGSLDGLSVAQAFHWFEPGPAKREFLRVLKPEAKVLLVWNERDGGTAAGAAYDGVLRRHANDYSKVDHKNINDAVLRAFLNGGDVAYASFRNHQNLDFGGLVGRVTSSSYAPKPGTVAHGHLVEDLRKLFVEHARAGILRLDYETRTWIGRPAA